MSLRQRLAPGGLPPASARPPALGGRAGWVGASLATALAYLVLGRLTLLLAIPPGLASPMFPAAGLALAMVLVHGRRVLPGVLLGSWALNVIQGPGAALPGGLPLLLPLATAVGAVLQAALGAALLRWQLRGPLRLAEPRDVLLFWALGGLVACLVNATLSTWALVAAGLVPAQARGFAWLSWWGGDTLGVLIATPICLTVVGRPRADWVPRRLTLGLPVLVTTALVGLAIAGVARWDGQRNQHGFERDANAAGAAMDAELRQALYALEAMHGLYIGSDEVSGPELARVTQPWLALPIQLLAMGYSERVARSRLAPFEAEASQALGRPYRVFDRTGADGVSPAADDADVIALRHIEPAAINQAALGVNAMSVPAAREAIRRAVGTDAPAATAGFRLTQETGDQTGVVIYRALYQGQPAPEARANAVQGVVFVSLRMQQSAAAAMRDTPAYLAWCLLDAHPDAARRYLAGPPGCEARARKPLQHDRWLMLGGQRWLLRLDADPRQVPNTGYTNAWLFAGVGLLSVAMLAALLLMVTGRNRLIEVAVAERTIDLQREVAERQRTESALRESEQRVRNIFEHAPIGIVYADLTGRVRETNPALREMVGYDADALAQRSLPELAHEDDRAALEQALSQLLQGGTPDDTRRCRLRHQDGQTLWVRMNWSLLRSPEGEPQRLVAVVQDITEHLRREEAEQGRQVAESANQAKNEFLSRMSHELRTPLNAMLGFGQLLDTDQRPPLAAHQRDWLTHVLNAGWHLLEMINDTLDLSRIDAGMVQLSLAPVDLGPVLNDCVAMVGPAAAQRQIALTVQLDPAADHAVGDATRLRQVLSNLLSNAVKYNTPGGQVRVETCLLGSQRLQVRVHDTGLGMSAEQMAGLFQPFNRLGREKTDTEGTGIGLVISRRLAELMGGTLHAESTEGQGATFVLTLPCATARPTPRPAATEPGTDGAAAYRRRRVHYVEDNETNVELMRGLLLQRPQVALGVSFLGLDGLQAIRRQRPDLVLLDIHLPDIDGLELLRQLQASPETAHIPVVMVSADATPARVAQALAAGARHYLTKPLNLASFLSVLDEVLEAEDTGFG